MKRPLVSIVVPVYNVGSYVDECLSSIADQTYRDIEVVIVDDGSTDDSLARCRSWASIDNRFRVYTKSNGGLSSARNEGLRYINGQYVCFVDSDDWVDRRYVERLLLAAVQMDVPLVCCGIVICCGEDRYPHSAIHDISNTGPAGKLHRIHARNPIACRFFPSAWNKIFSAELVSDLAFPEGEYFEDHTFFMSALSKISHFGYVGEKLYFHRRNRPGQITMDGGSKIMDIFPVIERIKRRQSDMMQTHVSKRMKYEFSKYIYRLLWERVTVVNSEAKEPFRSKSMVVAQDVIEESDLVKDSFIPWFIKDFFTQVTTLTVIINVSKRTDAKKLLNTIDHLKKQTVKSLQILVVTSKSGPQIPQIALQGVTVVHSIMPVRLLLKARLGGLIQGRYVHAKKAGFTPEPYFYETILRNKKAEMPRSAKALL